MWKSRNIMVLKEEKINKFKILEIANKNLINEISKYNHKNNLITILNDNVF